MEIAIVSVVDGIPARDFSPKRSRIFGIRMQEKAIDNETDLVERY